MTIEVIIKIEARDLAAVDDLSYYNNTVFIMTRHIMGLTHIKEVFDDVCHYPTIDIGTIEGGKFKARLSGCSSEEVPHTSAGGVWVEIDLMSESINDLTLKALKG